MLQNFTSIALGKTSSEQIAEASTANEAARRRLEGINGSDTNGTDSVDPVTKLLATGLALEEGVFYYITLCVTDALEYMICETTDGVTVDLSPPIVGGVADRSVPCAQDDLCRLSSGNEAYALQGVAVPTAPFPNNL